MIQKVVSTSMCRLIWTSDDTTTMWYYFCRVQGRDRQDGRRTGAVIKIITGWSTGHARWVSQEAPEQDAEGGAKRGVNRLHDWLFAWHAPQGKCSLSSFHGCAYLVWRANRRLFSPLRLEIAQGVRAINQRIILISVKNKTRIIISFKLH